MTNMSRAYNAESEQEFECTFDTIKDRYQRIIDELNLTKDLLKNPVIKKNFQDQTVRIWCRICRYLTCNYLEF